MRCQAYDESVRWTFFSVSGGLWNKKPQTTGKMQEQVIINRQKGLQEREQPTIIDVIKEVTMAKKQPGKKSKAGDILLTVILIAAIAVFCYAAFNLYHIYTEYKKGTDEYNNIAQMAVTERDPDGEAVDMVQDEPKLKAPMDVDFASLRSVNEDVIGWIYVEALPEINYPIVQGEDNETYLHTTYEKNYNFAGTIFVDYENKDDFSDCNTLVYGHNMKNGSMFAQLKKFTQDEETYKKSRYFWIFTPEKNYRYEIVSAYTTGATSDTYTLFKGPGEEFRTYLDGMKAKSEIPTEAGEMTVKDKIVTLSTCTGNEATRYVVQGVRVDAVDTE